MQQYHHLPIVYLALIVGRENLQSTTRLYGHYYRGTRIYRYRSSMHDGPKP